MATTDRVVRPTRLAGAGAAAAAAGSIVALYLLSVETGRGRRLDARALAAFGNPERALALLRRGAGFAQQANRI